MIRVEVRDFQSIAHQVVELDGFSVVAGRSNIGKSAMVRAIKAALTGPPADNFVRHDKDCPRLQKGAKTCKCFCSVHIAGDGIDLLWEKGDAVNRYVFNGREYTVVGRGAPDFLGEALSPVSLGGDRQLLQVFDQFGPLFLLDKSGTVVADALSDVAKLDQINQAARLVERDRKELTSTRKLRQRDVGELEGALERYATLEAVLASVEAAEQRQRLATELEGSWQLLCGWVDGLERAEAVVSAYAPVERVLVPDMAATTDVARKYHLLSRLAEALRGRALAVKVLDGVADLVVPDMGEFQELVKRHQALVGWVSRVEGLKRYLGRAKALGELPTPDVASCQALVDSHAALSAWTARINGIAASVYEIKQATERCATEEREVLAAFAKLGVCPTCNQRINARHEHGGIACE